MVPVSKVYSYSMEGMDRIIGVKFECGGLKELLPQPIDEYVDGEFQAKDVFGSDLEDMLLPLYEYESDSMIIEYIQDYLATFVHPITTQKATTQSLVSLIKNNEDIYTVKQVSLYANISQRSVQRYFSKYVGLSPKWLIRK